MVNIRQQTPIEPTKNFTRIIIAGNGVTPTCKRIKIASIIFTVTFNAFLSSISCLAENVPMSDHSRIFETINRWISIHSNDPSIVGKNFHEDVTWQFRDYNKYSYSYYGYFDHDSIFQKIELRILKKSPYDADGLQILEMRQPSGITQREIIGAYGHTNYVFVEPPESENAYYYRYYVDNARISFSFSKSSGEYLTGVVFTWPVSPPPSQ